MIGLDGVGISGGMPVGGSGVTDPVAGVASSGGDKCEKKGQGSGSGEIPNYTKKEGEGETEEEIEKPEEKPKEEVEKPEEKPKKKQPKHQKIKTDPDTAKEIIKKFLKGLEKIKDLVNRKTGEKIGELYEGGKIVRDPHVDGGTPQEHWNLEDGSNNIHIVIE